MPRIFILFISLIFIASLLSFNACVAFDEEDINALESNSSGRIYSHNEMIEIFAANSFLKLLESKESYILKYDLNKGVNQNSYSKILYSYTKAKEQWHNFIKEAIDFYIKKRQNDVQHFNYRESAYNVSLSFFDKSNIIDIKEKLPPTYWKLGYTKGAFLKSQKDYAKHIFYTTYIKDSLKVKRSFYNEMKYVIKKQTFKPDGTINQTKYFYRRKKLQ